MLEGIKNWKKKARRTSVTKFAAASGLVYAETDPTGLMYLNPDPNALRKLGTVSVTDVPFPDGPGGPWPGPVNFENMLSGRWQGLSVTEADFSILTFRFQELHRGDSLTVPRYEDKRFSAVIADLPAGLPGLMIQRKMPGLGGRPALPYHIESGSQEFNREFQVTTANTTFAAKLIDASMITWLLSARGAFMFKLYGRNLLLVWSYLLPAPGLGAIFDTAKSFTDRIPRQIWAEYGTREKAERQTREAGPLVSLACPGCNFLQQVPEGTLTTNCPNCDKEISIWRCAEINQQTLVLSEWTNFTHPGCKIQHAGPTVTCPACQFLQQESADGKAWICRQCGKIIRVALCKRTNQEFVVLSEWASFTHPGCRITHHW